MSAMDAETLAALKGSIRKWRKIVAGTGRDDGILNCPLCGLFYDKGCKGCPVSARTGKEFCAGSPYDDWENAGFTTIDEEDDAPAMARAELAFLKSLLPEGEAT